MAIAVLSFDVDAESAILAQGRRFREHAMVMTHQAFGPKVGVPRLLQLVEEYGLPATFFVPGFTAERYPEVVAEIAAAGHEIGHHSYSHRSAVDLTADAQRRDFELALETLRRLEVEPKGHRAALWEASWLTTEIVAEHGLVYDSSLMDSDRAYVVETPAGRIAELPPHWSLDDWGQYAFLPRPHIGSIVQSPLVVADMWIHELEAARRHDTLFMLTCHPFLSGRAGRLEALRRVIEAGLASDDVRFCSCLEVAELTLADEPEARRHEPVDAPADIYPED